MFLLAYPPDVPDHYLVSMEYIVGQHQKSKPFWILMNWEMMG